MYIYILIYIYTYIYIYTNKSIQIYACIYILTPAVYTFSLLDLNINSILSSFLLTVFSSTPFLTVHVMCIYMCNYIPESMYTYTYIYMTL
jgi:hypothetical protein